MKNLPWLEYEGQTTQELMACKNTHRIDSILCAFEWGIQAKSKPEGEVALTDEERLVLAVMALTREVNNGGYNQFFVNSSRRFAPTIVDSLRQIGCVTCADITEKAIQAAKFDVASPDSILEEDDARDAILDACDQDFYQLTDIDDKLFAFVEANQNQIQLTKKAQVPRRKVKVQPSNQMKLHAHLSVSKPRTTSLDEARQLAREVAKELEIDVTDKEVDAVATLHAFESAIRNGDEEACEALAGLAFDLARDETTHCVAHREYVKQVIGRGETAKAEALTRSYLDYLASCDVSTLSTQNRILFWGTFLQEYRSQLPESVSVFIGAFPFENFDAPLPRMRFKPKEIPRGN